MKDIEIDVTKNETEILYPFYYKDTPSVNLKWEITQGENAQVKKYESDINLTEYGITEFEISY